MKLSEAIRLGAMLKPQAFDDFTDGIGTCAWGAANEAIGLKADGDPAIPRQWWSLCNPPSEACPECGIEFHNCCDAKDFDACDCEDQCAPVSDVIVHLNDDHQWTREQIADWVSTIEAAHDQAPAPVHEAVTA